ncbi:fibrinogen-like protein 1 [Stomoxys calcitrans]|uniref:fibrinogen-like protein 1 n=1 Tax=Stomoxys calcitrans TaxID=35570 RepID=UPI0027E2A728|nr:fibrinogen-like protein 1 [Stomoxys calcitrans]
MNIFKNFLIFAFIYFNSIESANIPTDESNSLVKVESLKLKLQQLELDVRKQLVAGKLQWQLQTFQKWYQDAEKCSRDISYIFDDWTIIQRRINANENFHRNWTDYSNGFGDKQGSYFLGLEEIHQLTNSQPQELLVLLGDDEGKVAYAKYENVVIGSEKEKYELKELGEYSGDAGDSLCYHVGKQFSTFDQDNNDEMQRCAKVWVGGWWFGECFDSNLNGSNMKHKSGSISNEGIVWKHWHGMNYSLEFAQMMIRSKV